jgi:hypothetical protein
MIAITEDDKSHIERWQATAEDVSSGQEANSRRTARWAKIRAAKK